MLSFPNVSGFSVVPESLDELCSFGVWSREVEQLPLLPMFNPNRHVLLCDIYAKAFRDGVANCLDFHVSHLSLVVRTQCPPPSVS